MVEVNWLAIVLATLSSMVVGSIWYARPVFGDKWMGLVGIDPKAPVNAVGPILITLIVSFITAFVLAHMSYIANQFFQGSFLQDSLITAVWLWAGLTAARFITHDQFERRPVVLTLMNVAHELVTLLIMAVIIGLLTP